MPDDPLALYCAVTLAADFLQALQVAAQVGQRVVAEPLRQVGAYRQPSCDFLVCLQQRTHKPQQGFIFVDVAL